MRRLALVLLIGSACGGAPPPPTSATSGPSSTGDVADPQAYEDLTVFFARKRMLVSQCYNNAFAAVEQKLRRSGYVTVEMQVTPSGKAQDVRVAGSSLGSKEVEDCVVGMVSRWTLPQPPKKMAFSYSYEFKPE